MDIEDDEEMSLLALYGDDAHYGETGNLDDDDDFAEDHLDFDSTSDSQTNEDLVGSSESVVEDSFLVFLLRPDSLLTVNLLCLSLGVLLTALRLDLTINTRWAATLIPVWAAFGLTVMSFALRGFKKLHSGFKFRDQLDSRRATLFWTSACVLVTASFALGSTNGDSLVQLPALGIAAPVLILLVACLAICVVSAVRSPSTLVRMMFIYCSGLLSLICVAVLLVALKAQGSSAFSWQAALVPFWLVVVYPAAALPAMGFIHSCFGGGTEGYFNVAREDNAEGIVFLITGALTLLNVIPSIVVVCILDSFFRGTSLLPSHVAFLAPIYTQITVMFIVAATSTFRRAKLQFLRRRITIPRNVHH